jgi:hypothetical protein
MSEVLYGCLSSPWGISSIPFTLIPLKSVAQMSVLSSKSVIQGPTSHLYLCNQSKDTLWPSFFH